MPLSSLGARSAAVICAIIISLAIAVLGAQQAPLKFRSGVEAVVLDVSVLDRDRHPVRGLTAKDFTILEDGQPQDIRTFKAIDLEDVVDSHAAPWVREVAPDIGKNDDLKDRRIVVIVMDSSTPMPAPDVLMTKTLGRAVIDQLAPDDLAAVVYTFGKNYGQNFTQNRALLRAAVDRFNGSPDNTPKMDRNGGTRPIPFNEYAPTAFTLYHSTLVTLHEIAVNLAELPERRKALIFVSVGLPLDASLLAPGIVMGEDDSPGQTDQLLHKLMEGFAAAQRANVSIYSIDPGGLRTVASNLNQDFLKTVSDATGGFAVLNTNDPAPGVAQIFRENGSYYLLGYQPAIDRTQGRFRKVEVRVNRRDVTVRARNGYFEPTRKEAEKRASVSAQPSRIADALAGIVPRGDISLRAQAVPFARAGSKSADIAIVVQGRQPIPAGPTPKAVDVDVLVHAYDLEAQLRGSERLSARVGIRPGAIEDLRYGVLSRLTLSPGRYQLRIAAGSATLGKTGSVYCDLDVPDLSKGGLSLSGILLDVTPAVPTAPKGKLSSIVPVVPTAEREFMTDDQVSAFIRLYQGGKDPMVPVAVTVRIVTGGGAEAFSKIETLGPERFTAARAADYLVKLPISSLAPGPHLLSIEAKRGTQTSRQDVRFVVQ